MANLNGRGVLKKMMYTGDGRRTLPGTLAVIDIHSRQARGAWELLAPEAAFNQ